MIGPTAFTLLLILLSINPCLLALLVHTFHPSVSSDASPYIRRVQLVNLPFHNPSVSSEASPHIRRVQHSQNLTRAAEPRLYCLANMPTCSLVDLDDDKVDHLLDEHVPKGHLSPKKLFRVKENSNGTCSNWAAVKIHSALISDVLEATEGQLLRHKKISQQLGSWLKKNGEDWCKSDIETSADGLRIMMRSLKALKSDDRSPPAAYSCLKALLEK